MRIGWPLRVRGGRLLFPWETNMRAWGAVCLCGFVSVAGCSASPHDPQAAKVIDRMVEASGNVRSFRATTRIIERDGTENNDTTIETAARRSETDRGPIWKWVDVQNTVTCKPSAGTVQHFRTKSVHDGRFFWSESGPDQGPGTRVRVSESRGAPGTEINWWMKLVVDVSWLLEEPGCRFSRVREQVIDGAVTYVLDGYFTAGHYGRSIGPFRIRKEIPGPVRLFVRRDDMLLRKIVFDYGEGWIIRCELTDLKTDIDVDRLLFEYLPPPDALLTFDEKITDDASASLQRMLDAAAVGPR